MAWRIRCPDDVCNDDPRAGGATCGRRRGAASVLRPRAGRSARARARARRLGRELGRDRGAGVRSLPAPRAGSAWPRRLRSAAARRGDQRFRRRRRGADRARDERASARRRPLPRRPCRPATCSPAARPRSRAPARGAGRHRHDDPGGSADRHARGAAAAGTMGGAVSLPVQRAAVVPACSLPAVVRGGSSGAVVPCDARLPRGPARACRHANRCSRHACRRSRGATSSRSAVRRSCSGERAIRSFRSTTPSNTRGGFVPAFGSSRIAVTS